MASAGLEPVIIEDLVKFGEDRGLERGLRLAVADLCEAFGIDIGTARRAHLEAMSVAELEALRATIKQTRRWPKSVRATASTVPTPSAPTTGAKRR